MTHFEKLIQNSKEGQVKVQVWNQVGYENRSQVDLQIRGQTWIHSQRQVDEQANRQIRHQVMFQLKSDLQ
jgi:hypothetical protein